jgi:hypothetical protein
MKRIASLTIALVAMLFLSGCVGSEKLPEDLEEHESEYGFSIDLPKGWVIREWRMPSPGDFDLECYPSEHGKDAKNPDVELRIWNTGTRNLDDFVRDFYDGEMPEGISDRRIADRAGKKVISRDDENEYTTFYFQIRSERDGLSKRYYYCRLLFRRELSSFDDADWNRFVDRIAGSLELED